MADNIAKQLVDGVAIPTSISVQRECGQWVVQCWYHGVTVYEALHPVLIAQCRISIDRVPLGSTWRTLYREVAIEIEAMASGEFDTVHVQ